VNREANPSVSALYLPHENADETSMNTPELPPPLPPGDVFEENPWAEAKSELPRKLATASLVMPLVLGAINLFTKVANNSTNTRTELLVRAGIFISVLLVGAVLAIIALGTFRRGMQKRVLARAVLGLLLNGALITVFAFGFVRGRRNSQLLAQNAASIQSAVSDIKKEAREALERGDVGEVDLKKLERANRQMVASTAKLSGDPKLIANANAAVTDRALLMAKSFQAALKPLVDMNIFSSASVNNREVLQERRKLVEAFIASARDYKDFQAGIEKMYREELQRQGVKPASMDQAVAGFRRGIDTQNPLIIGMREADVQMGGAMLAFIDLLDSRWGKWSYNKKEDTVTFESDADLAVYHKALADYEAAAERQVALQRLALK
jgi:hypothetical protein